MKDVNFFFLVCYQFFFFKSYVLNFMNFSVSIEMVTGFSLFINGAITYNDFLNVKQLHPLFAFPVCCDV